jgi:hypothetical protein
MESIVHLEPTDILTERPFTDPTHTMADLNVLRYMSDQLSLVLGELGVSARRPRYLIWQQVEPDGRQHRIVIIRPETLRTLRPLLVVGFFGQRRQDADPTSLHPLDQILIDELPEHPGLLSYSTLALPCGNFGNLILFADRETKSHWSRSKYHAQAIALAPDYYSSVRIYNGLSPEGLADSQTLSLTVASYYDYQDRPMWRAMRHIQEG